MVELNRKSRFEEKRQPPQVLKKIFHCVEESVKYADSVT